MAISTSISLTTLPTTKANPSIAAVTFPAKLPVSHGHRPSKAPTTMTSASKSHQCLSGILGDLQRMLTPSSPDFDDVQTLSVYELNEGDRRSPAFLKLSKAPEKSLGDIVTFTNKLYSGDLTARLGITAGLIIYIERDPVGGDRYEAVYSFHFGKFGHVSVQGPYFSDVDSVLAVTGGTGVFEGATGNLRLTNVAYPFKLFYTFELKGIDKLPTELVGGAAVEPSPEVKPLTPTSL